MNLHPALGRTFFKGKCYYSVGHLELVWLKRDIRWVDHEPLTSAMDSRNPVLILYVDREVLHTHACYSKRHFQFVEESLSSLDRFLAPYGTKVLRTSSPMEDVLKRLQMEYDNITIHSHQETGVAITYDLDKKLKAFCLENSISWVEYKQNGVERGLTNRVGWMNRWYAYMDEPLCSPAFEQANFLNIEFIEELSLGLAPMRKLKKESSSFQPGGTDKAMAYLASFFRGRGKMYMKGISKPEMSRKSCSRLSPYLAWGNLSMRYVYQEALRQARHGSFKTPRGFLDRLRWQAHFIQKFEMECSMEFRTYNSGYIQLNKSMNKVYFEAWKKGQTGYPLVDACMRCLKETGYLNFRMRAMVASFAMHHLWLPWQPVAHHLAQQFLDFEPGIHFPQIHMQGGLTGVHTLRIYNPTKQAEDHDEHGSFIYAWVQELKNVPLKYVFEPWKMPAMEQAFSTCRIPQDYPAPIVDIKATSAFARDALWSIKSDPIVRKEAARIVQKHIIPSVNPNT